MSFDITVQFRATRAHLTLLFAPRPAIWGHWWSRLQPLHDAAVGGGNRPQKEPAGTLQRPHVVPEARQVIA